MLHTSIYIISDVSTSIFQCRKSPLRLKMQLFSNFLFSKSGRPCYNTLLFNPAITSSTILYACVIAPKFDSCPYLYLPVFCKNISSKSYSSSTFNSKELSNGVRTNRATEDIVLTPGQKVVAGANLTLWTGAAILATASAYYIIKELFPTKMSPNIVFDRAFSLVKDNNEVISTFGAPLKAYGKDRGGHREGRRNIVEHTHYTEDGEGSKRTRVRFNIQGQYGSAFVFAEVSNKMSPGDFVYGENIFNSDYFSSMPISILLFKVISTIYYHKIH